MLQIYRSLTTFIGFFSSKNSLREQTEFIKLEIGKEKLVLEN